MSRCGRHEATGGRHDDRGYLAADVRAGRADLRAAVLDDHPAAPRAETRRGPPATGVAQGARLAAPCAADRQRLPQSARAAAPVLRGGAAGAYDRGARRHYLRAELDVRAVAVRPRLYPCHQQPARPPQRCVPRGRHCVSSDVGDRRRPHPALCFGLMTPGARASAVIEILADIEARKRPAAEALKDWGLAHRFAGSGDRAAIGHLVFDALRTRVSAACAMGDDSPRALVLRTLVTSRQLTPDQVAALADGSRHAPEPLADGELEGLRRAVSPGAPAHIRGDYPEWLGPH